MMHHNPRITAPEVWSTCDSDQPAVSLEEAVNAETDNAEASRAEEKKKAKDVVAYIEKKICRHLGRHSERT